ncbi:DUF362 domain-containing protein [Paramaledivibacter caminithermalis]|jgi:uncharacterized protein (DUF362 family)|uniref:Uncharacterized conserved protein, DUF362 family n=1 Tax=Paramaledivibacter caminithermalis (strain DSM 15212 / CIP 107654 / DViRD3) TaxID=1121301 RepID=A0A1M6MKI7_PARC5|nr:DUF362 domain-containing protein [Paramaledivibacter caminithermalis]SHJ83880.1 Uncharacterized conserved protein, DUF362 family [Paramaledivibacter caminithermalis DSM 15212]
MRTCRRVSKPIVAMMKDLREEDSLTKALDLLPMKEIIKEGDKVVITPNWVKNKPPYTGTVVGPCTLQRLIKYIKNFKPLKIIIATGSGGDPTPTVMNSVGYDKIIKEEKVEFIDLNYGPYVTLALGHTYIKEIQINNLIDNMDVLISFTQLKHHEEATMSGGIKNIALGWPPAEIHGFPKKKLGIHEDLHGFIVSMAQKIPIDLTIVSADKAMIGTGPSTGKSVDSKGLILAGTDPVAVDTIGARLLGFLPQAVYYLYQTYKAGIGEAKPENMELKGLTLEEAERLFSLSAYNTEIVLDKGSIKNIHGNQ